MTTAAYETYRSAVAGQEFPLAFVDRDALDANIQTSRRRSGTLPVRVASKSIRCRDVLRYILDHDGFHGVLCYTGHEAAHLAADGFDDLLVAYPAVNSAELTTVCDAIETGTRITLVVDDDSHIERIADSVTERSIDVPVCIDLDMSTEHFGIHFGVRRSGVQTPETALSLAETIADTSGVSLAGVMGYEAQIAGLPDDNPSNDIGMNTVIRGLKRRSAPLLRERREKVIAALDHAGYDLAFVNGGGTGSAETTRRDTSVTELTVGSGFYAPQLFDHYRDFQYEPAAGYAAEIVRQPTPEIYTCRGGGYIASGPPGIDKTPTPQLPDGASLLSNEGAGEVQTPVEYDGPIELDLGDPVFFRHAKAGELCAHFEHLHVIADGELVDRYRTYRGDDECFL